jgi:hypothetical protein
MIILSEFLYLRRKNMKKLFIILLAIIIAFFFIACPKPTETVTLTVNINPTDSGSVTVEVEGETLDIADIYEIEKGKEATLTAQPNTGYEFVEWDDGSNDLTLTVTLDSDTTVTANFQEIVQYNLTVTITGNGSVTANGTQVTSGTPITFPENTDVTNLCEINEDTVV